MIMWDEKKIKPKAILWANFAYVSLKESRRATHPDAIMKFYENVYWDELKGKTFDERVKDMYIWGKEKK